VEPSIHIRTLDVRCPPALGAGARSRLAAVASRELPAALLRTLGALDDGRLIFVRRLEIRARLGGSSDQVTAAWWAEAIATAVREGKGDVVVFARPLDALVAVIEAALGQRAGERIGAWPWVASGFEAIRDALVAVPGADGRSHAFAVTPPLPVARAGEDVPAAVAVAWAIRTAGALVPALIAALAARGIAAAALGAITPAAAAALVELLVDDAVAPAEVAPVVARIAAEVRAWPAAAAADPRNQLLVAALVVAERPSLHGTPALASVRALAAAGAVDAGGSAETAGGERAGEVDAAPLVTAAALDAADVEAPAADLAPVAPEVDIDPPAAARPGVRTRFGGLLFLLDPLRRLGVPAAILDEPALATDPGLPALLYGIACRLAPDAWADPCALVLTDDGAPQAPATAPTAERLAAAARARDRIATAAAQLPARPLPADRADLAAHAARLPVALPAWLDALCVDVAAHVAAQLRARLDRDAPLAELVAGVVARDAVLAVTRTHVDVTFELAALEVDALVGLRRAALDLDPGWVPFLGRIVGFHYV
jgi:hypothetical protein